MSEEKQANANTPMMRQYLEIKRRYKNEILFFRMGDFYEMFLDDAIYAARVLDIALTRRQDNIPMCGIPHHSVHNYVHRILDSGKNIAICEQIEDPKEASGRIVKRDVVRVLTPGSIFEEELLGTAERRQLAAALFITDKKQTAPLVLLAAADISTSQLWIEKCSIDQLAAQLQSRGIKELVFVSGNSALKNVIEPSDDFFAAIEKHAVIRRRRYTTSDAEKSVQMNYGVANTRALELAPTEEFLTGCLFLYIKELAPGLQSGFSRPQKDYRKNRMGLDESALKTLEILFDQDGKRNNSLYAVLDHCTTTAGKRLLDEFLGMPSVDIDEINRRHEMVEFATNNDEIRNEISQILEETSDLQRLLQSLSNNPQVRQLGGILETLTAIKKISKIISEKFKDIPELLPQELSEVWFADSEKIRNFPEELFNLLDDALYEEKLPPVLDERRFIRPGYSQPLDELFALAENAHTVLKDFEQQEKEKYDIPTLKVKYNRVIGYFIEISKGQATKAPEHYHRRQTLVNAERFTIDKLKELENSILNAHDEILITQKAMFGAFVNDVQKVSSFLHEWAAHIARLDVLNSFAHAAVKNRYIRPEITEDDELILKSSRHPVVEVVFKEEVFVPNDVHLNTSDRHLAILTGPNMSGKSTYIRQIGLIQIMAQAGSFVPVASAIIPVVDRVFTRIGAFDRLFRGESTFFVEMVECARIFQNFTERSLILLDEVGRGTSTFDGISIARSMVEYLNSHYGQGDAESNKRPKTLFATHYAELAEMIEADRGIVGLTVQVLEENDKITFLRRIKEGVADQSYGIFVAELAGMPPVVINRAKELLQELESEGLWQKEPKITSARNNEKPARDRNTRDDNAATNRSGQNSQLSMFD